MTRTYSPRKAAFELLCRLEGSDLHADNLLDRQLENGMLKGPDRGLFTELVLGQLRKQGTLDHYLSQLLEKPLHKLDKEVLILLRQGLYQLAFLDRIPIHAAVHESVELSKSVAPKAAGLVNAVLRGFLRRRDTLKMPEPSVDPARWLEAAHSIPRWLGNRWLENFSIDETASLGAASSEAPMLTLRVNRLRIKRDDLLDIMTRSAIDAEPCRYSPDGLKLLGRHQVKELPGFAEGLFCIQDEASQLVAMMLAPEPGESLLDICAAPGGKATHLAEIIGNNGSITATDINQRKIARIRETAKRLGATAINPVIADGLSDDYMKGVVFDRILLDAPCSGVGVIRRNPEAKWRLTQNCFSRFAERQRQLLSTASRLVRTGGTILYATCSTEAMEDEGVVEDFLSANSNFVLENPKSFFPEWGDIITHDGYLRTWPHRHQTDGFFAARIKRIDS